MPRALAVPRDVRRTAETGGNLSAPRGGPATGTRFVPGLRAPERRAGRVVAVRSSLALPTPPRRPPMHATRLFGLAASCLAVLALALPLRAAAPAAPALPPGAEAAAQAIHQGALEAPVRFLASDALEGRAPATRGDQLARLYLENELRSLGLTPGGPNSSWQQRFPIVGIDAEMPPVWSFSAGGKTVDWKRRDDYIAASGVQRDTAALDNAELVFVGYGIQAPEYRWDDFKGMDLAGK